MSGGASGSGRLLVRGCARRALLPLWTFDQPADLFGLNNAMDALTGRAPADDA